MTLTTRARGLLLTLGLLSLSPLALTAQDETVSLNFANAEIDAVIKAIGKISGKNFLIDPRVKGTLNIVTNTPVSRDLSYQILLSALRLQGYTAVEGPGVTKIVPEADAKLHGVPVGKEVLRGRGDSLVTQVFPMRNESVTQMLAVVRPLVSPNNTVTAFPSNNVLVVTDYADNVARIARIIDSVDVPQGDVHVLELRHAAAVDLAATLNRLMNDGTGNGSGANAADASQRVQVVPDARTNSLLVRTENPSRISALRQLVASLDRPGAGGNIHVVYLKNAEATKVAQTLNGALAGDGSASSTSDSSASSGPLGASTPDRMTTQGAGLAPATYRPSPEQGNASERGGMIQADPVNNALIIVAPEAIYRNLRHVIDLLDRRRAQVYIEALIAEISTERAAEFGIQWQSANTPGAGSSSTFFGGTNFGGAGQNIIGAAQNIGSVGKGMNFLLGGGTVKVPINGQMVEVFNLSLLARFLETDSRTNILSTPSLVTLDNEGAKIVVGRNLPFITGQYTNTGGGTTPANPFQTIERRDVGLTLEVRPQISEGGAIRLDIYQEASSVVPTLDDSAGPTTNKRSIQSTVLVDDGAIIALGGLVEDDYSSGEEKVPLLGDIPFAGSLFRYDTRRRTKTNLVVFLRPVILRDRDSYSTITNARYDYIIGQQRNVATPDALLRGENTPPELPAPSTPAPAVPVSHAPGRFAPAPFVTTPAQPGRSPARVNP
ncbi:type II secretion system secretin GspD [Aromatoleum buckelii]|uniref:Type II secretion system secretin GspD n=1 Tax=Aromatoleum buckelii TaxID=200254 RepID=A0ABX1MW99_9RHOO|nr:type II secretion system secretin GspD [Aromatoleum buckelii]MCK0511170.1 type II secretion system secretin GspD [Aromatoleum buckelii]